jgi:uncharacterized protein YkwD
MRGHGRRLTVAIAIGAIAGAALLATVVPNASAASSTPTVTLNMSRRGWVNVHWQFSTTVPRTDLTLWIQRGDTSSDIGTYMTIRSPRQRSSRYDKAPMHGTDYYRVVLLNKGQLYGASSVVSITDNEGGTAPPTTTTTVKPTTTTTAKPTTTTTKPVTTTTKATTTTTVGSGDACSSAIADVERLVNADRKSQGKPPLADNAKLDKAAQTHTDWMANTGNFSHSGWDTEIANAGYKGWTTIGQNIAAGQTTAASVESAWFNESPPNDGHRQNILNGAFTNMGVGCTHVSKGYGFYWAEDFGNGS